MFRTAVMEYRSSKIASLKITVAQVIFELAVMGAAGDDAVESLCGG